MNILYISQYFPPEIGATQTRAFEMAKNLVARGHRVTMMTEMPNHPTGIIPPEYQGRFRCRESLSGINVFRSWVYANPVKNFRTRMLFYLSFMVTTILNGFFLGRRKHDIVYTTSPPLFAGLAGLVLAKVKRIPFIFEVRDLWPESAVEMGELNRRGFVKYGHMIAKLCYRDAKAIVAVTQGIYTELARKGISEAKLYLIKNGTNPEVYHYQPDPDLKKRLGWDEKFVVLYAGVHGIAQGLETVLEGASQLQPVGDIRICFIGEGPVKKTLMEQAAEMGLENVEFLNEIPSSQIARYISIADLCLVPLRKKELFKGALPSKIFDSWACGKPVLLSVDGEARREVEAARGGIYVEPENPQSLAEAVIKCYRDPNLCEIMGQNGRQYIHQMGYIRSIQAAQLEQTLSSCL